MGNFEKLVVLTVLFLAATILGISMHGDGEQRSDNPLGEAGDGTGALSSLVEQPKVEDSDPAPSQPEKPAEEPKRTVDPDPVVEAPAPVVETPEPIEASAPLIETDERSILVRTDGLVEPFQGSDYLYYTLQPGDNVFGLAERYYGARRYHELLRQANVGADLGVGDAIMVPRYDLLAEAVGHVAKQAAPAHEAPVEVPATTAKSRTYTVTEGDSLWTIAADAYGKGSRWGEIYQANRHQLDSEHDLKLGMELIIP